MIKDERRENTCVAIYLMLCITSLVLAISHGFKFVLGDIAHHSYYGNYTCWYTLMHPYEN